MADQEEVKEVEAETPSPATLPLAAADVAEEKAVAQPLLPISEKSHEPQSTPPAVKKTPESPSKEKVLEEKPSEASVDRDAQLARIENEKRMSLIKAWEESEKCKAENKAYKKIVAIEAWKVSKKASIEAELRKIEEQLEKKKAEYAEQMKNKMAMLHKEVEEKKAMIEAKRGEDVLKVEEMAAKYRTSGKTPTSFLVCFKRCG